MSGTSGDFSQYIGAVRSRLWLIVLVMAVAVGGVYWRMGDAPPRYSAEATLLVTAPVVLPSPTITDAGGDPSFRPGQTVVSRDIVQLITSRPIAERVAARLGLAGPGVVRQAVDAQAVRETSLVRVTATAPDARQAADLANVTAEEFVAFFRETNRASISEARRFVEEQLAMARVRLEASERAIQAFKERRQMPSVPAATEQILSAAASGQTELDTATVTLRETEARLAAARERLAREQPVVVASRSTSDNPVFRRYQDRLVELEIQRATLSQTYTPQHPRMEQISREIADVRSRLTTEARTAIAQEVTTSNPIHARLLGDVVTLEVERTALAARVEGLRITQRRRLAQAQVIPAAETEFNRLVRENRVLEANYTALSTRYQEILLRENQAGFFPASLQLIEPAAAPTRPVPSSFPRTAAAAALAGLVLGVLAALVLESLNDRIRGSHDAERVFGVPVLATIPQQGGPTPAHALRSIFAGVLVAVVIGAAVAARHHAPVIKVVGEIPDAVRSAIAARVAPGAPNASR